MQQAGYTAILLEQTTPRETNAKSTIIFQLVSYAYIAMQSGRGSHNLVICR